MHRISHCCIIGDDLLACFLDFVILTLTAIALGRTPEARNAVLWRTLFRQGISYFLVALFVNVLVVVCVCGDVIFASFMKFTSSYCLGLRVVELEWYGSDDMSIMCLLIAALRLQLSWILYLQFRVSVVALVFSPR